MTERTEREGIAQIISEAKASFVDQVPMPLAREIADRIIAEHIEPLRAALAEAESELCALKDAAMNEMRRLRTALADAEHLQARTESRS